MSVSPGPEVLEGRRVTFTCRSHGAPPPVLVLSREGVELWRSDSAPSLTFSLSVRPRDPARYRCDATNAFGTEHVARNVTVGGENGGLVGRRVTLVTRAFLVPLFCLPQLLRGTRR